ncbi:universal stress protein [Cellulophaga sp. Hel_I_12]|uniref:universal stress protein n=1 Tax=Cellulophaga sp. Hel_I_12 TaxID=1249972 RepID=UPI000647A782|nr:universal stress protein [Cellulophaga sp. Hel_I_12]
MDKRILIPTDFSKNALNATRYALNLYAKVNCEFYFLNVFQLEGYTTSTLVLPEPGSETYEHTENQSKAFFVKFLNTLKLHHDNPKHTYHTISSFNFLSEAIKEQLAKKDIDIVIMGTKGATNAKDLILGSNTVKTMEKITACPVLAIPENTQFSPLKEIVFPTDYKTSYKRKEMNYLIEIAKLHSASIRVLHIKKENKLTTAQEDNKQLLEAILSVVEYSFHVLSDTDLSEGITSFVESRNSDMIAFINRKHFFFGNIFSKPLVKEIGYDAITPILALH